VREGYYFPYKTAASRQAIWDFVDDIPFDSSHPSYSEMLNLAERLPRLKDCPVQIIWGLKDPCFHRAMLDKVARHFPQARVLEIPDASHLVLEDAPQLAGETILQFFKNGTAVDKSGSGNVHTNGEPRQNVLYEGFCVAAEEAPTQPAVIEPLFLGEAVRYGHTSFRELAERINKYQRGLSKLGLGAGDRVLMLVPPGVEFLALSFAVMGRGAIPVFIDPGIGKESLFKCIRDADPNVFIGAPRAQLLRLKRSHLFPNLRFHITSSDWIYTGGPGLSYLKRFSSKPLPPVNAPETAFIAFTSGATGTPKGVVYTNEMLHEQLQILKNSFAFRPGDRDLPLLPIFSLFHLANGVCSVFPAIDSSRPLSLSPSRILRIVHDLQVKSSFGSPTLWNKIAEYCVRSGDNLGSLKRIFMAGAPVSKRVLERVGEVMSGGETFTPYGATEALPVTLLSGKEIAQGEDVLSTGGESGTRVGKAVHGVSLRVVQEIDESDPQLIDLQPRHIGEIVVSGKNVSPEYFRRDDATKRAKIRVDGTLWHRMGDLGYLDESGELYFCGRIVHRVVTPERTYYSVPTEKVFNAHEKVKRSALVSLGDELGPGIVVEPLPEFWPSSDEERSKFLSEIEALARTSPLTESIHWFFLHPSFPVDARHNAKIFRDQLSEWAQKFVRVEEVA
ncbi:MAG: AMP-binding protein, partial [Bdellovibrionales bacterium]|nr:AMP-binding protein [Bdellovibrionales bacterium]